MTGSTIDDALAEYMRRVERVNAEGARRREQRDSYRRTAELMIAHHRDLARQDVRDFDALGMADVLEGAARQLRADHERETQAVRRLHAKAVREGRVNGGGE